MTRRMAIIGAGDCGTRAALALRAHGWEEPIAVVDSDQFAPYERPPLSKAVLQDASVPPGGPLTFQTLSSADIELIHGRVESIDREASRLCIDARRELSYHRLLLATGSTARGLSVPGGENALRLRTWGDALRLRGKLQDRAAVVIIGGGFLGLEIAASAALRGCSVTVIEQAPRVLERLVPASIASIVAARHRDEKVEIRCGVTVAAIRVDGRRFAVELRDADTFMADVVVAAVGARPSIELADLAELETGPAGIVVDGNFATADESIFAAGDCCSFPFPFADGARLRLESWRNAVDQGEAAALALLGSPRAYEAIPWFWSDQYDLTLQIAGMPGLGAREIVRAREDGAKLLFGLTRDGRLISASAIASADSIAKDILLAMHAIRARSLPSPNDLADPSIPLRGVLLESKRCMRGDETERALSC